MKIVANIGDDYHQRWTRYLQALPGTVNLRVQYYPSSIEQSYLPTTHLTYDRVALVDWIENYYQRDKERTL